MKEESALIKAMKPERGQAIVEFALVLPLLIVFMFGLVEFSLVLYNQNMITNAAREGARVSGLFRADPVTGNYSPFTDAEVQLVVANYLNNRLVSFGAHPNPPAAQVVPASITGANRGQTRTVTQPYTYTFLVLPNFLALGNGISLTSQAQMRIE